MSRIDLTDGWRAHEALQAERKQSPRASMREDLAAYRRSRMSAAEEKALREMYAEFRGRYSWGGSPPYTIAMEHICRSIGIAGMREAFERAGLTESVRHADALHTLNTKGTS